MIILDTNLGQTLKILPIREKSNLDNDFANAYLCSFTDEQTKQVYDRYPINVNDFSDLFFMQFNNLDFFYENAFFHLEVRIDSTQEIIYRDRIFVTDQDKNQYSVNNNVYISPSTNNNDYIVIP